MSEDNSINKNIPGRNLMEALMAIPTIEAPEDFRTNFAAYGEMSETEIMLLLAWRKLSTEQQQQVLELIASLAEKNQQ